MREFNILNIKNININAYVYYATHILEYDDDAFVFRFSDN